MNLTEFLDWEDSNGIYRSEAKGQFYRVVDNKLEVYDAYSLKWEECNILVNKLYKLKPMKKVGAWSEGFAIHNEEEWELVKTYYLEKGFEVSDNTILRVRNFIKNNVIFYAWIYFGKVEVTIHEHIVKRDLVLKPINWQPKFYAKYVGSAKFENEMYWQINGNRYTVSLVEGKNVVNWDSIGMLNSLKDWKRCGITLENTVFIPTDNDEYRNATYSCF